MYQHLKGNSVPIPKRTLWRSHGHQLIVSLKDNEIYVHYGRSTKHKIFTHFQRAPVDEVNNLFSK